MVDTTHEDNSIFSFEIGEGTVIKAWDLAVKTMKVNGVRAIARHLLPGGQRPHIKYMYR